jgi:hypothetical protein
LRMRLVTLLALLCLSLISASPIAAQSNGNGNGNAGGLGNGQNGNGNAFGHAKDDGNISPPAFAATPELDSLALFATGAAGMVGYGLMRIRAGRRQDKTTD